MTGEWQVKEGRREKMERKWIKVKEGRSEIERIG